MPLYFFQTVLAGKASVPNEGIELANIDAAWEEATATCGEIIRDMDGSLKTGTEWSIEVQDEFRNTLRSLTVSAKSHRH